MELLWLGIIAILLIGAGVLSARLCCYKKQIAHLRAELELLEREDTNYRLTSVCDIGGTEEVIAAVNRLLARYREEEQRLGRENRVYRESITGISHDIRTPLTSARGYLQMLQSGEIDAESKAEYLRIVERRLDELTDLLNQLFEYARIEAGEMTPEPELLNAGNLFAETLSLFFDAFRQKGCEPEVTVTPKPCHIFADRRAFKRIVENLTKNALVHGTGDYRFALTQEQSRMLLRVSNRTDSIAPEDIERIFDRFYTTDKSRSRRKTGLGLAIVRRLAEQMGGTVRASLSGERFMIEVRLPLAEKNKE